MKGGLMDPFGLGSFFGMRVVEAREFPRYTLPDDVPPPPGMTRAEFAAWSREVCGMTSLLPKGTVLMFNNHLMARPSDVVKLINC